MAQTVCVLLKAADTTRLSAIAEDRSRPLKHIHCARIVLLSAERLSVQDVARRTGVSRPAVWRWQRQDAPARDTAPFDRDGGRGAGADLLGAAGGGHPRDRPCRSPLARVPFGSLGLEIAALRGNSQEFRFGAAG